MRNGEHNLTQAIEIYEVGARRLYAKTSGQGFAIFEDELTPAELVAIALDIEAHQNKELSDSGTALRLDIQTTRQPNETSRSTV